MRRKDPEIGAMVYFGEALGALDAVLPQNLGGKHVCITILQTFIRTHFDRRALHQSDLDALHEAFADAVDEMGP
jgi:hypothetical protein